MRPVAVISIGQVPVKKRYDLGLRELGAAVVQTAIDQAGLTKVDALFASNMLSDELQGQKHIGALIADTAGLAGIEAWQVRAATASGAAALRAAFLAVASGAVDTAVAVGVEKMSSQFPTSALAKALDARSEIPDGKTLLSQNAALMQLYLQTYRLPDDALAGFAVNAHLNARNNPNALYNDRQFTSADVMASRLIHPPLRLLDCAPVCDGAAAVVLAPSADVGKYGGTAVSILASSAATDRFRMADRPDPLYLKAAAVSLETALNTANINRSDIDFFELHDAFSIMACLLLEADGFAERGKGWQMAAEGKIGRNARLPIATMGGLKARGHPIGATALYQTCEIVQQLTNQAGQNQIEDAQIGLLQSVGGAAATVFTHIFGK